jgi:hypothetical protein
VRAVDRDGDRALIVRETGADLPVGVVEVRERDLVAGVDVCRDRLSAQVRWIGEGAVAELVLTHARDAVHLLLEDHVAGRALRDDARRHDHARAVGGRHVLAVLAQEHEQHRAGEHRQQRRDEQRAAARRQWPTAAAPRRAG